MKELFKNVICPIIPLAAILLTGCASFTTTQVDQSTTPNEQGILTTRTITTRAASRTLWESKSALSQFQARQTDQDQSASVGGLTQQSASPVKDLADLIKALNELKP
jgi:hypothetical protein